tara:strand:- start:989 stop:1525 length:537 start_codon:yes stop_codon:yes gene_type:complete
MTIIPLFPTNIHHVAVDNYSDIKADLIGFVDAKKNADPEGGTNTGWHSELLNSGIVLNTINSALIKFFNNNNYYNIQNFEVTSHWLNVNKPGDNNVLHCHPGAQMSGVLWIHTPPESGDLIFESPNAYNQWEVMKNYTNEIRQQTLAYTVFDFTPDEGSLVFFPGSLYHSVVKTNLMM